MSEIDASLQTTSVHLIDEDKHFAKNLDDYVKKYYIDGGNSDNGLNYHIVSVFGSQSTGKSTLLNKLFGTKFDVMDEEKRQQTTKGIWFSHANYIASAITDSGKCPNDKNIYVLDVEGVDGRERAEDKDFERKSALFALATSEILIVNIFEHQVGLYQGANMELLKTVMEVNLSLFHKQSEKCLLLFVIRDFTGLTPLSNLGQSLQSDMQKIWEDLNKPEECKDSTLQDFFDLKFFSISHKHFQIENFDLNIKQLGDEFLDDNILFNNNKYHKRIPIDGWSLYSEKIWDQIENNKDLDLPTQQILVSKFKCNEILNNIYEDLFLKEYSTLENPADSPVDSCLYFRNLRISCLQSYDTQASRYKNSVYLDIREDLSTSIDSKLKEFYIEILSNLSNSLISQLKIDFSKSKKSKENSKKSFEDLLSASIFSTIEKFKIGSKNFTIIEESDENSPNIYGNAFDNELEVMKNKLEDFSKFLKYKESNNLINKLSKKLQIKLKDYITEELSSPTEKSWDNILQKFHNLIEKLLKPFIKSNGDFDFGIGLSNNDNNKVHVKIMKNFWSKFESVSHDFMNEDSASRILRNSFEDSFKFDSKGLPLIWKNFDQLDSKFNEARDYTLKLLPILSSMKLEDNTMIQKPVFEIADSKENGLISEEFNGGNDDDDLSYSDLDSDDEDENSNDKSLLFSTLLTIKKQEKIKLRFKKETDAIYLDAKRAIVLNKTSIPTFMYVLLILLGWNEFMTVLRNPILFILLILVATGLYFAYNLQMLGPLITVVNAMLNQTKVVVKEKLRDVLLDDGDKVKTPASFDKPDEKPEEAYELQDL